MRDMARAAFEIGGQRIAPGTRRTVDLPVAVMSDHTPVTMSVHVIHGRQPGPVMFVSAAVHGDEVIGVEILRRLLAAPALRGVRGTLLAVPIVNTFGFLAQSRYLPDRRDLNRSFPGSEHGSLAARLADLFLREVVARADYGIDLHSAAQHRTNLAQIRVSPGDARALRLAQHFGAPVILTSAVRPGSLREVARARGVTMLLFEGGEALRFDEMAVRAGVSGILRVLRRLDMTPGRGVGPPRRAPLICTESRWLRAPKGGLFRTFRAEGTVVAPGEVLGVVSDPMGIVQAEVQSERSGIVIGRSLMPVVNEGDALFHLAAVASRATAETVMETLAGQLAEEALFDEDEII